MKKENIDYSIYIVTDSFLSRGKPPYQIVSEAIEGGASVIQYRDKRGLSTRSMIEEANRIMEVARKKNIPVIINDRLDIALAIDADGIHLGQDDLPIPIARKYLGNEKIIGASVRNIREMEEAIELGSDYLAISGIFPSTTKLDVGVPIGLDMVKKITKLSRVPVIGIGGINVANAGAVIRSGAAGVAVVSAVVGAKDPAAAVRSLRLAIRSARTTQ